MAKIEDKKIKKNEFFNLIQSIEFNNFLQIIYFILEENYKTISDNSFIKFDPLFFPKTLFDEKKHKDNIIEFYALLSSTFAFGNRKSIMNFLSNLFNKISKVLDLNEIINNKDNENKINFNVLNKKILKKIINLKYRWLDSYIISSFITSLLLFYKENTSIFNVLITKKIETNKEFWLSIENILQTIKNNTKYFFILLKEKNKKQNKYLKINSDYLIKNYDLKYKKDFIKINSLIPSFSSSSLKRFMLFLKWCNFKDNHNLGIWDKDFRDYILYPLDTHILKKTTILFLLIIYNFIYNNLVEKFYEHFIDLNKINLISRLNKINTKREIYLNNLKKLFENFIDSNIPSLIIKKYFEIEKLIITDNNNFLYNNFVSFFIENFDIIEEKLNKKFLFKNCFKDAILIKEFYKIFSSENPLKYDFSLTFL
ncbi:MAG: DUF2400 family protein [Spirochaetes bacterium]|nr:DUF2400 family protein [Spirochaetota bacterium]